MKEVFKIPFLTQTQPNDENSGTPQDALAAVRKQIALCNEGIFVSFLNKNPQFQEIFHSFSIAFKQFFTDVDSRQKFIDAIIGQIKHENYVDGVMQGEIELLTNFLETHREITNFLQNRIGDLQEASDAFAVFSDGAYDYSHIDSQTSNDLLNLIDEIRIRINAICEEAETKLKSSVSDAEFTKFFSSDPFFRAINQCNVDLRVNINKVAYHFTPGNEQPGQVFSIDAVKSLKARLQSGNAKLTEAFNQKVSKSSLDYELYEKMNSALNKLYEKANKIGNRALVFSKIYKTVPITKGPTK